MVSMLEQIETGQYIFYKDHCNEKSNEKYWCNQSNAYVQRLLK